MPEHPDTVTYMAVSLFTSRTFWFNALSGLVGILSATDVVTIIPPRFLPLSTAIVAMANIYLRTITVRPTAMIAPGTVQATAVTKIGPPPPSAMTD